MSKMNSVVRLPSSNLFKQFISSGPLSSPISGAYRASNGTKNLLLCNYWRGIHLDFFACYNQQRPYHRQSNPNPCKTASVGVAPNFIESSWMRFNRRYSSTMPHNSSSSSNNEVGKEPKKGESKARILFNKYGYVFVGTYLSIYVLTLISFFFGLDSGLLDPGTLAQVFKVSKNLACETADVIGPTGTGASMNEAANAYADEVSAEVKEDGRTLVEIVKSHMRRFEWTSGYAQKLEENPHLANLGVAWFIVKLTEPIRLAAAVIVTPKVAKMLGRKVPKI
ncbi:DUF1279 domain-containing protein [Skeletonema marinoi]|uniref:DUF1279 domain-containing protein n=1 Tax=Skeletonema marinoi TaxID=267567 RepID=A0AAD8Y4X9_9STRA|nr:DUF1279 domain-containing protein [Skeletonema marinoi]